MKRACLAVLLCCGCENYDLLLERCRAEGRCSSDSGTVPVDPGVLKVEPAQLSFSEVIGDTSDAADVTVTNAGPGAVDNLLVDVPAGDFQVAHDCPTGLAPLQQCTLHVRFAPGAGAAQRSATLSLRPARGDVATVSLGGTAGPALEVSPSELDFGDVALGTQPPAVLQVKNLSRATHAVTATTEAPFFVESNGCPAVASQQTCPLTLRFSPPGQGTTQGPLHLGVQGGPYTVDVTLKGRGLALGSLQISPPMPFNGEQIDAGLTLDRAFTVTNVGTQTLGPLTLSIADGGGPFSLVSTDCGALDAGASCGGTLRFSPAAFGSWGGRLDIAAGAAGVSPVPLLAHATAVFSLDVDVAPHQVAPTVFGDAPLTSGCADHCTVSRFVSPTAIPALSFTAQRNPRFEFWQWQGACSGDGGCTVALDGNKTLTAQLEPVSVVFVSENSIGAPFGGVAALDRHCQAHALDAGLPGTFRALVGLSDGGVWARIPNAAGWIRPDGQLVAGSRAELMSTAIQHAINVDQSGARRFGNVWTGFLPDGGATQNCADWTSSGTDQGTVGNAGDGAPGWIYDDSSPGSQLCGFGSANALYCFQVDGRGHPVPAPAADGGVRMFLATGTYDGGMASDAGWIWPDDLCARKAATLGLQGQARAMVSSASGTPVSSRFDSTWQPIYRPDGTLLFPTFSQLTIGIPYDSITVVGQRVDTGSSSPATAGTPCSGWTNSVSSGSVYVGYSTSQAYWWSAGPNQLSSCQAVPYTFYCLARP